jgi:hypothetical protein
MSTNSPEVFKELHTLVEGGMYPLSVDKVLRAYLNAY